MSSFCFVFLFFFGKDRLLKLEKLDGDFEQLLYMLDMKWQRFSILATVIK